MLSQTGASFAYRYDSDNYQALLLLGYIGWNFSVTCISLVNNEIRHELERGTFYQKLLSKFPLPFIYSSKLISAMLVQLIVIFFYTAMAVMIFGVRFNINLVIISTIIICIIGMYGIGLMVGAATLLFKKVGNIILLLQLMLLFVTDTIPTNSIILTVSRFIPLTIANDVIRTSFSGGRVNEILLFLIVSSIAFLVGGTIAFQVALNRTRKNGSMLLY